MTNKTFRENRRLIQTLIPDYYDPLTGITGRTEDDTDAAEGLDAPLSWVRLNGGRSASPCVNKIFRRNAAGVHVDTAIKRSSGDREILGIRTESYRILPPSVMDKITSPSSGLVEGEHYLPGRVEPDQGGGLTVYIRALPYYDDIWIGGTHSLSTEVGALSSAASAMLIIGIDTATNTIDVTVGTEHTLIYGYALSDAAAITLPAGVLPLWALVIKDGQTAISDCWSSPGRQFDLRPPFTLPGGSSSGFPEYGTAATVAIASGVLDISGASSRNIIVQAESGTADTVTEVVGLDDGESALFRADAGDTITFEDNSDILLYNGVDVDVVSTNLLELVGRGAGVVGQPVDQNDGGTSIGTLIYEKWDVDAPPASPHASDDEFEGAVSGSWTDFDHGSIMTYAASPKGKGVRMVMGQAAVAVSGLLRAVPSGDFSMITRARISTTSANTRIVGFLLAEGTGSGDDFYFPMVTLPVLGSSGGFQLQRYTAYNAFAAASLASSFGAAPLPNSIYLRVRRISSTYYFDLSYDGEAWMQMGSDALASISAVNYVGIGGATNNAGAGDMFVTFDFFRVSTDTALDTPISGQLVGMYAPP